MKQQTFHKYVIALAASQAQENASGYESDARGSAEFYAFLDEIDALIQALQECQNDPEGHNIPYVSL